MPDIKPNTSRKWVHYKEGVDVPWKKVKRVNNPPPLEKDGKLKVDSSAHGKTA
jgi:hypothetical protein